MLSELSKLTYQVHRVPEKHPIQVLTPERADQPLNEGVGDRSVRNRLDLSDLEHSQVGERAVESKQRVVSAGRSVRKMDRLVGACCG